MREAVSNPARARVPISLATVGAGIAVTSATRAADSRACGSRAAAVITTTA